MKNILNLLVFQMLRIPETYQNKTAHVLFEWKLTESTKTYCKVHTNVKRLEFCMKRIYKLDLIKPSPTYTLQAKGEHDLHKLDNNIEKEQAQNIKFNVDKSRVTVSPQKITF